MADHSAGLPGTEPPFNREKHVRYWLRCFKTLLPERYTSTDSNRVYLAFMILCALDILGELHNDSGGGGKVSTQERADAVEWIYGNQHPDGGFRGFPGTDFSGGSGGGSAGEPSSGVGVGSGAGSASAGAGACWDPPNLAGTVFSLLSLVVLRDDLGRVRGAAALRWLTRLQAPDGSLSEILGPDGRPSGARDTRQAFFAVVTRHILRGRGRSRAVPAAAAAADGSDGEPDLDVPALLGFLYSCQTNDGGIGQGSGSEAHGGYAYCAAGCLALLGQLPSSTSRSPPPSVGSPDFVASLLHWLVHRQVHYEPDDGEEEDEEDEENDNENAVPSLPKVSSIQTHYTNPDGQLPRWVGFDGRCNKPADSCYEWWVGAAIMILTGGESLIDFVPHRRFLLEKAEHVVGGFGKTPGDLPDALHSFFGLATLGMMGESGLNPVDAVFCITKDSVAHLERIRNVTLD